MIKQNHKKGIAMVYIMIVISGIILATALSTSSLGIMSAKRMQRYGQFAEVRALAMHCVETVLMNVRNNTALTASSSLTDSGGTCVYTVTGTAPNKVIAVTASKYNIYKRITVLVTQVSPTILATWVEGI